MNGRPKHIPIRTCVVCREKSGKRALTRIVRTEAGLMIDLTGKAHGRGAYLCDNPDCWQRAASTEALANALRTRLSEADRELLRQRVP
jgi:predicted RNA-binding protein YlxR (DUF448 family)